MTDPDLPPAPEVHPVTGLRGGLPQRVEAARPGEGLRERKKRLTRQQISDTATGMFLQHGFDEVRVADVAAACGVSEKTVYNYFPTKESLLLDREEGMADLIRRALGPGTGAGSPVEAMVDALDEDLRAQCAEWEAAGAYDVTIIHQFAALIEGTPSLRAAQQDMMQRLVQVAAEAMAARAGVDPDDPEPQIAATAIGGLYQVEYLSMRQHAVPGRSAVALREAVMADIRRAARLIDTGLWSFGMAVQGTSGRDQLKAAAAATNEARKQVVAAIQQARDAWQVVIDDARARGTAASPPGSGPADGRPGGRHVGDPHGDRWARAQAQRDLLRAAQEGQRAQRAGQQARRENARARREQQKDARDRLKAEREAAKAGQERAQEERGPARGERQGAAEGQRLRSPAEEARAAAGAGRSDVDADVTPPDDRPEPAPAGATRPDADRRRRRPR